ncbi:uncharacterized protein LOC135822727 [Sycon ciliatum]|uniref:uncharacterized protein LOC135822727 n=1 Tax=Sycon ciliatum TaxID=27933 RepID=UPI0031F613B0
MASHSKMHAPGSGVGRHSDHRYQGGSLADYHFPDDAASHVTYIANERAKARCSLRSSGSSGSPDPRSSPRGSLRMNRTDPLLSRSAVSTKSCGSDAWVGRPSRSLPLDSDDFVVISDGGSGSSGAVLDHQRRTSPMHNLPSPSASPTALILDDEPPLVSFTRAYGRRVEPVQPASVCRNEVCVKDGEKLQEAMLANRTWEKHTNGLQGHLHRAEMENESLRSRINQLEQKYSDLRQQAHVARQTVREQKAQIESLTAIPGRRQSSADGPLHSSQSEDMRAEMRAVHMASMEKDAKIEALTKQVEKVTADFRKERHDRKVLQNAIVKQQEQLLIARNEAASSQNNLVVATKEKDILLAQLKRISQRPAYN